MNKTGNHLEWRVNAETVPGASHLRARMPNQDSVLFVRETSGGLPVVLSVSDGHGSPKCFRSDRGSRFAVREAVYLITGFLNERRGNFDTEEIERNRDHLAAEFVHRWRDAVEADLGLEPFSEDELQNLEKRSDARARDLIAQNPLLAYGATSLTVAVLEEFVLYMQLGDGDFLSISAAAEVTKPVADDARLLANETTSLCLPEAENDVRFRIQQISPTEPAMILVSTDGYLNSFSNEAGFFQAGTDILNMLKPDDGYDGVNDNLRSWLEEATAMGSGDDCTVAILYRPELVREGSGSRPAETTSVETPPSAETSEAIAALTDGHSVNPGEMEDVTVTITIKKDKNKKSASGPAAAVETNSKKAEEQFFTESDRLLEKEARR